MACYLSDEESDTGHNLSEEEVVLDEPVTKKVPKKTAVGQRAASTRQKKLPPKLRDDFVL